MRLPLAIATLTLSVVLAACGGSGGTGKSGSASFDLTIGALVPLRGDLAAYGPGGRKAAELAVLAANQANRKAGGRIRVHLVTADSETQPIPATIAARRLVKKGATCLVGDWSSASTIAVANQVAAKLGVLLISPASTNFGISKLDDRGYVFRTAPSDALQVVALADLAERSLGSARGMTISIAARDDAYGNEFSRRFATEWRRRGGRAQGPILYDPTAAGYTAEAKRIVAGAPDAFVIADFPETYAKLAPALLSTNRFNPAHLFVTDTLAVERAADWHIPTAALTGAQGARPGIGTDPKFKALFSAQTYDAATLCYLAAKAAGSSDPGAIKDKIREVSKAYQGASGRLNLDANGDVTAASYAALRFSSAGVPQPSGRLSVRAPSRAP
jgi:branched-chain amino acid transport system substrate-binding protein